MKVKNLKSGLEKLVPVLSEWEAKKIVVDFQKLIELMDSYEDMSVAEFCSKAKKGLDGKGRKSGSASRVLRDELVAYYHSLLKDTELDDAKFEDTMATLSGDKKVRLQELKEIANRYNGYELTFKNKAAVLNEITTKRNTDRRTEHKFKILSQW